MKSAHMTNVSGFGKAAVVLLALFSLVISQGCSFIASSKSSSKIISSPFTSSARSSDGDDAEYQAEAEGYTQAFTEAGGGAADSFQRGLSGIAAKQGISDWEANPGTWVSVGRGLGRADLSEADALSYAEVFSGGSEETKALMLQGYSSAR